MKRYKYQEKIVHLMDTIIGILLITILIVEIYQNRTIFYQEKTNDVKYYNVTLYDYHEEYQEKTPIPNAVNVTKITTITVPAESSLELTLKSLENNCPVDQNICQDPSILKNKVYQYNKKVKDIIVEEERELNNYWECFNKSKTKKQKNKCEFNYYFNDYIQSEKYNPQEIIQSDIDILVNQL